MRKLSGDKTGQSQQFKVFGLSSSLVATLVLISPILFVMAYDSESFGLAWNEGRGGFIFAMAFIAAELIGLKVQVRKNRLFVVLVLAALTIGYFVALPYGLKDSIQKTGEENKVALIFSWVQMWDFIIMAAFTGVASFLLFGKNWYKIASAGAIFLAGNATVLALDAFFPYDSLGALQFIVPIYLQIDQSIVSFIDQNVMDVGRGAVARGNLLVLNGLKGPFALQVFWPSAGVDSMIIFSLVMLAFLLKMEIPRKNKIIYFAIGAFGTAAVNVTRIISLTLYALIGTTDPTQWEVFHSVAGIMMFLPWLGIFLAVVLFTEGRRVKKLNAASSSTVQIASGISYRGIAFVIFIMFFFVVSLLVSYFSVIVLMDQNKVTGQDVYGYFGLALVPPTITSLLLYTKVLGRFL